MNDIEFLKNASIIHMRKAPSKIISWITILILSSILFIYWALTFKYYKYLNYEAYVNYNKIELYVDKNFFDRDEKQVVIIGDKEYQYKIKAIDEYSYNDGVTEYWKVVLEIELPKSLMINNNRLKLKFLEEETTFYKSIIKKIKKGMEQ